MKQTEYVYNLIIYNLCCNGNYLRNQKLEGLYKHQFSPAILSFSSLLSEKIIVVIINIIVIFKYLQLKDFTWSKFLESQGKENIIKCYAIKKIKIFQQYE